METPLPRRVGRNVTNTAVVTQGNQRLCCEVIQCPEPPVHPQTFIELLKRTYPLCLEHRNRHLAYNYTVYLAKVT